MDIITTIFTTILAIFIGIVALMIFIQSNVDLWKAVKPEIQRWLRGTRLEMWYKNRKNKPMTETILVTGSSRGIGRATADPEMLTTTSGLPAAASPRITSSWA